MQFTPPVTLITGATDGIGLALTRRYRATSRRQLLLLGRRPFQQTPLVDDIAPENYCQVDLAQPTAANQVAQWLTEAGIKRIDLLIHNAALGYYGDTAAQPAENIRQITAVNLGAPVALTHALLPLMPRPGGQIVFISSVVSALPCPDYSVYGATKAALDGFALNLRLELRGQINVQLIRPGATRSGIHQKSGLPREKIDWSRFPPAETVARQIDHAISGGRSEATLGAGNRLARFGGRYLGGLVDAVLRRRYR